MFRPNGAFFVEKVLHKDFPADARLLIFDVADFRSFVLDARRLKGGPIAEDQPAAHAMFSLSASILTKNPDLSAIRALLDAIEPAIGALWSIAVTRPELLRPLARQRCIWPVLATFDAAWDVYVASIMTDIQLGQDCPLLPRFRHARGDDQSWPTRLWAKAAVATLTDTLNRLRTFDELRDQADILVRERKWQIAPLPAWAKKLSLPPLSKKTLNIWKAKVRELIREEFPGFENHEDWKNIREAKAKDVKSNATKTTGIVQNRILGDICESLKSLAPE